MSEKMIVHVGMHKTGSTAIQNSLAANLKDERYKYVSFQRPNGSLAIRQAFFPMRLRSESHRSDHQISKAQRNAIAQIERSLSELKNEIAIVSAEEIYTLPKDCLNSCMELFRQYRKDLQVSLYLRNIKSYIDSSFQQKLKSRFASLDHPHINARYQTSIQLFEEVVGPENVKIWHFNRKKLQKNCVVQDFCRNHDVKFASEDVISANESLSIDATRLLYIYRQSFPTRQVGDETLVARLSELKGSSFRLGNTLRARINLTEPEQITYGSERLNVDLSEDESNSFGPVINSESDMYDVSNSSLDWLAQETDTAVTRLESTLDLAEAINLLRVNLINKNIELANHGKSSFKFELLKRWLS